MIILGIDPGTATIGVGVVECKEEKLSPVFSGWIETSKDEETGNRLCYIHDQVKTLIQTHKPDILAIERLFFFMNHRTAMSVSESIGVIKMAASSEGLEVVSLVPKEIKLIVSGDGRADKTIMKKAVRNILGVRSPKKKKTHFDDLADALAVAICYARKYVIKSEKEDKPKRKGVNKKSGRL